MKLVKLPGDGRSCIVRLDLEGLKLPHLKGFDPTALLDFSISTYRAFRPNAKEEEWMNVKACTDAFFASLNDKDLVLIAETICMMHFRIKKVVNIENIDMSENGDMSANGDKIMDLINELAQMLDKLDKSISLYEKARDFVVGNLTILETPNAGNRSQDTDAMTFRRNHKLDLTAIAVICKMLSVITGTLLEAFTEVGINDRRFTDVYCFDIYKDFLANECADITEKLEFYVASNIDKRSKKTAGSNTSKEIAKIVRGETLAVTESRTFASLFTRKFVNISLTKPEADIMTFVYSCIINTASNPSSGGGGKDKPNYVLRFTPDEKNNADDEEGNDSIMETESIQSEKTADTTALVGLAVDYTVSQWCNKYGITLSEVEDAASFYTGYSHIRLDIVNSYILANVFGDDLLGAKSIELLDGRDLARLVAVLQVYLVQEGYHDLVHLVSAVPTGLYKSQMEITGGEKTLITNFANNAAYRNCATRYTTCVGDVSWDTNLRKLIDSVTGYKYKINTAPAIWEMMGQHPENGDDFIPAESLSESICRLILTFDKSANLDMEERI